MVPLLQINERFRTATKGTYDQSKSSGAAELLQNTEATRLDHWLTRAQSVLRIGQNVGELILVFRPLTKTEFATEYVVIDQWPKTEQKCVVCKML